MIIKLAKAFNNDYATNKLDSYFNYYTKDATLFFYGEIWSVERYKKEWYANIKAGGGVDRNDISKVMVRILPGGNAAVATYFVDNQSHSDKGEVSVAKAFETDVWQKTDNGWKIVSLHYNEINQE